MRLKSGVKRGTILSKGWNIAEFSVIAENRNYTASKKQGRLYYRIKQLSVCKTTEEAMKCFCDYLNKLEKNDEWKQSFAWELYFWKINENKIEKYTADTLCETYFDIEFK